MVGIACHQHMGDHRLGRNAAFDQPRRRRCLYHGACAGPAGKFRTLGHDHPKLCGDHIQPLRGVLPDHRHDCPAARACGVLGCQRHLDPRQMRRQRTAARAPLGRSILAQLGIALLRLGVCFGDRLLDRFEAQLQLFLRQTFGAGAEVHAFEL